VRETHRWVTSGNKNTHSQYWQNLIQRIARQQVANLIRVSGHKELRFSGRLTRLCVNTNMRLDKIIVAHLTDIQLQQQVLLQPVTVAKNEFCGYFWPQKAGWYSALPENKSESVEKEWQAAWLHIASPDAWLAVQQAEKIKATLNKQQAYRVNNQDVLGELPYQPMNPWIFWWMFFISASFIWLEKKLEPAGRRESFSRFN